MKRIFIIIVLLMFSVIAFGKGSSGFSSSSRSSSSGFSSRSSSSGFSSRPSNSPSRSNSPSKSSGFTSRPSSSPSKPSGFSSSPKVNSSATKSMQRSESKSNFQQSSPKKSQPSLGYKTSSSGKPNYTSPVGASATRKMQQTESKRAFKADSYNVKKSLYDQPSVPRKVIYERRNTYWNGYASRYSGPIVFYNDPYDFRMNWYLSSLSAHEAALFLFHHHNSVDSSRIDNLVAQNAQIKAELMMMENQLTSGTLKRNTGYVPAGMDPTIMYSEKFIEENSPKDHGWIFKTFMILLLLSALSLGYYFFFVKKYGK